MFPSFSFLKKDKVPAKNEELGGARLYYTCSCDVTLAALRVKKGFFSLLYYHFDRANQLCVNTVKNVNNTLPGIICLQK